jgi:hypothetical protein
MRASRSMIEQDQRRERPDPGEVARSASAGERVAPPDPEQPVLLGQKGELLVGVGLRSDSREPGGESTGDQDLPQQVDPGVGAADVGGASHPPAVGQPDLHLRVGEDVAVPVRAAAEARDAVDVAVDGGVVAGGAPPDPGLAADVDEHQDATADARPAVDPSSQTQAEERHHPPVQLLE